MLAVKKYGINNFRFRKIASFRTRIKASKMERGLIDRFRRIKRKCYNIADGGFGGSFKGHCGHKKKKLTRKWRENISKGCKGVKKKFSKEHCLNISKANKGRKLSRHARENIRNAVIRRWKIGFSKPYNEDFACAKRRI